MNHYVRWCDGVFQPSKHIWLHWPWRIVGTDLFLGIWKRSEGPDKRLRPVCVCASGGNAAAAEAKEWQLWGTRTLHRIVPTECTNRKLNNFSEANIQDIQVYKSYSRVWGVHWFLAVWPKCASSIVKRVGGRVGGSGKSFLKYTELPQKQHCNLICTVI